MPTWAATDPLAISSTLRARTLVVWLVGASAIVTAVVTLAGWFFDVTALKDWDGDGISMKTNTAVAIGISGVVLLALAGAFSASAGRFVAPLAAVVGLLGAATLFEHLSGVNLGIDTLLFNEPPGALATAAPNRMGPPASVSFTAIGTGLTLLARGGASATRAARGLGWVICALSSLSLVGYLYGASQLFAAVRLTAIALHSAILLHCIGWSLVLLGTQGRQGSVFGNDAGAWMARRLLPAAVLMPIGVGWFAVSLVTWGVVDFAFGQALVTLLTGALLIALIVRTARRTGAAGSAVNAARQALAGSEARYSSTFDVMPIGVVEIDSDDRRIIRANKAFQDLVGRLEWEVTGRAIESVARPDGDVWQVTTTTGTVTRVTLVERKLTLPEGRSLVFFLTTPGAP